MSSLCNLKCLFPLKHSRCLLWISTLRTPTELILANRDYSKYISREARMMTKLLTKHSSHKKKFVIYDNVPVSSTSFDKPKPHVNTRRIKVLNKLFMQRITDYLVSGDLCHYFIDKGVQITRLSVSPDFKIVNVFWFSPNVNENLENMLDETAHNIRHELSQLRVMGSVPKISFVKDSQKLKLLELDKLLSEVSEEVSQYGVEDSVNKSIDNIDSEECEIISNVYGLERDKILKKISVQRSKKSSDEENTPEPK